MPLRVLLPPPERVHLLSFCGGPVSEADQRPLLDRIDMFAEVPPVEYEKLVDEEQAEDSARVRQRVEQAREIQRQRFRDSGFLCDSEMGPADVWKFCSLDDGAKRLLQAAMHQLNLSARAFHRILKVSRTIADLSGADDIGVAHLAEALRYRPRGVEVQSDTDPDPSWHPWPHSPVLRCCLRGSCLPRPPQEHPEAGDEKPEQPAKRANESYEPDVIDQ